MKRLTIFIGLAFAVLAMIILAIDFSAREPALADNDRLLATHAGHGLGFLADLRRSRIPKVF